METIFPALAVLAAQSTPDIPIDSITNTAKSIEEFGISTVMCAVLLIFTGIMFTTIIRRTSKDEVIVKLLTDLTNTVNTIKNSDVDVASSFDRHNTKFILEVEHLKMGIKSVEDKLVDIDHDGIDGLRQILTVMDQECSDIRDATMRSENNTKELKEMIKELQKKVDLLKK